MLHSSEIRLIDLGVTCQRGSCMEPPVEEAQASTDVIRKEIPKKPTQIWHLNKLPKTLSSQRYPNNRWKICSHVKGLLVRSKEYPRMFLRLRACANGKVGGSEGRGGVSVFVCLKLFNH